MNSIQELVYQMATNPVLVPNMGLPESDTTVDILRPNDCVYRH